MSEYQYYEFLAIDRALTKPQMSELRRWSSRARITPSSFVNDYSWGGFKGDEDAWMLKYFDAFIYLANWSTHILKFKFPAELLSTKIERFYCGGDGLMAVRKNGKLVLTFQSDCEGGEDWVEGDGQLSAFVPLRAEIAQGDHRALYLGWLLSAQNEEIDIKATEPPVPPGLKELSAALESLVEFMRVDEDLLTVAAEASDNLRPLKANRKDVIDRMQKITDGEKDKWLARILEGEASAVTADLRRRLKDTRDTDFTDKPRRTVGDLLEAAQKRTSERQEREARHRAEAAARRKREAERSRAKYLDSLAGREAAIWEKIEKLVAETQPGPYDEAVTLLKDLRDLAERAGDRGNFHGRLDRFRKRHSNKPSLAARLRKANL